MAMQRSGKPVTNTARRHLMAGLFAAMTMALVGDAAPALAQPQQSTQVLLTENHIEGFIAANKAMSAMIEKIEASGKEPTPKQMAALDALASKHGFKDFNEYEDVAETISLVFSGIDPQTKEFTQPPEVLKKEIEAVKADKSLSATERKELLAELNEQLKNAQNVEHPANIKLVQKYYAKLEAVFQ
jgi:hypothetical protein